MKAAVVNSPGFVTIETIADPTPEPNQVVVSVAACGICGTDLHILRGEFAPTLPVTPGHEFAGEIVALGRDVDNLRIGDDVVVDPSLYCYACQYCRRGRFNLCDRFRAIGVSDPGGAAEFVAAPAANCVRLPKGVAPADATLVEPLSCAIRGFDVISPRLGDHVLIFGAGTMGLMILELAKRTGAASVEVVEVNRARLKRAERFGCSGAATCADAFDRQIGWEIVIDCTGAPAAIEDGIGRVAKGGTFLQFGVADYDARIPINPYRIYNREITITGSMAVLHSFERAAELFFSGVINPADFITDRLPLSNYQEALDRVDKGQGLKVQVCP